MTDDETNVLKDRLYGLACDAAEIEEQQNHIRRLLLDEALRRLAAEPDEENDLVYEPAELKLLVYTDRPCTNHRNVTGCCYTLHGDCLFCDQPEFTP